MIEIVDLKEKKTFTDDGEVMVFKDVTAARNFLFTLDYKEQYINDNIIFVKSLRKNK